jgi:hypothetical protein
MKEKKLKIANIGDWTHRGGHLYVAGYSQKDMVELINEAYGKVRGNGCVGSYTLGYFRGYGSMGCWGDSMNGIVPERGVWWEKKYGEKPVRII